MNRSKRYSHEIRERAVRMVFEHQREYESEWVDWFNNRRPLEPIGNVQPAEYEMMYYRQLEESSKAA